MVVLTDQIIGEQHGPTKTTLDRCRCLIKDQNKKVILTNSNDLVSLKGMVSVYNTFYVNTRDDLQNVEKIEWKEVIVPYYQCVKNGMTIEQMHYVITAVEGVKPSRIIVVGGGTSCVEAMYKGVPVVALEYGDVAVNVGEEFVVGDYQKMINMVHGYKNDKPFYGQQVIRAQKCAKSLMDTNKHLTKLMEEVALREDNGIV